MQFQYRAIVRFLKHNQNPLLTIGLLLLTILVRLRVFSGIDGSDPIMYSELSYAMTTGNFSVGSTAHSMRPGLLLAVAVLFKLFKPSELTAILYPLMLSILQVGLVVALGKLMLNERAGWLAGLVLSLFPADALLSSQLLPDLPAAALATLSMTLVMWAGKFHSEWQSRGLLFLAGLALGWGYLTKEVTIILYPVLFVAVFCASGPGRRPANLVIFSIAFFLILGGEASYFLQVVGNPFPVYAAANRVKIVTSWFGQTFYGWDLLKRLTLGFWAMLLGNIMFFGYHFWFLLAAACRWLTNRANQRCILVWIWLLIPLLFHEFASISLKRYVPISLVPRYLAYTFAPLALAVACWLDRLMDYDTVSWRKAREHIVGLTVLALLVPALYSLRSVFGLEVQLYSKANLILIALTALSAAVLLIKPFPKLPTRWQPTRGMMVAGLLLVGLILPWRYILQVDHLNSICERTVAHTLGPQPDRPVYSDERTGSVLWLFYHFEQDTVFRDFSSDERTVSALLRLSYYYEQDTVFGDFSSIESEDIKDAYVELPYKICVMCENYAAACK